VERRREEAEDEAALSNGSDEEDDDKDEEAVDIEGKPLVLLSDFNLLTLTPLHLGSEDNSGHPVAEVQVPTTTPLLHLYQLRVLQQPSPGYVTLLRSPIV
jgi:hypothetical protein